MYRVKTCGDVPCIFANKFTHLSHIHPTNLSKSNFPLPKYLSHKSKYKMSIRGLALWNKVLSSVKKKLQESSLFKTTRNFFI